MRKLFTILYLFQLLLLNAVDFDVIVIGTSPIPMCEAIYQASIGKSVLLLEQWPESGGAWKSITACGIPHADMGCHQLVGANSSVRYFLEKYIGCNMVPMETPLESCSNQPHCHDFYFSRGCYELIHNLERIIAQTNIVFLLNHPVDLVALQEDQVIVTTKGKQYSTNKVITVPGSYFGIEGIPNLNLRKPSMAQYRHLYLLIQDPTGPRFSYLNYSYSGISRCMNLTHFVGLTGSGRQLFVFQAYSEETLRQEQAILEDMKKKKLVDSSAYILQSEVYIYEQFPYNSAWYYQTPGTMKEYFEVLDTSAFGSMARYTSKWEQAMKPFKELFRD